MASERKTENLIRDLLRSFEYYEGDNGITVEEQKSEIAPIKKILARASKNGKGNPGYPEFIISNKKDPNFLMIVECKSETTKHESVNQDQPVDYAVDGAIHYAKHLSEEYTARNTSCSRY